MVWLVFLFYNRPNQKEIVFSVWEHCLDSTWISYAQNAVVPSVPQRVKGGFQCPLHGDRGLSNLFNILDS